LKLRNRIVALPIGLSRYVDSTGTPTERMVEMFRAKAMGGCALVTVEATYIDAYAPSVAGLTGLYDDGQIAAWSVVTDAIHGAGALASIEIFDRWHTDFPYAMEDMSAQQIEAMIGLYVRASVRAVKAGFDAITFQMTHGWPLSRFASPLTNNRHDRYGELSFVGSEVIRRTRDAVGPGIALIPRYSIREDQFDKAGVTLAQAVRELTPAYEEAGADILDLSFGLGPIARTSKDYWATEMLYVPSGDKFAACKAIKDVASVPVIGRSGVNTPEKAREAVDGGWMDLLGLGRQLLADPAFPRKLQEGREDAVTRCIRCQFCGRVSVGGRGGRVVTPPLHCSVNGALGREISPVRPRADAAGKVVAVVGAGPAGLEAALGLEALGCKVVLFEKAKTVGGLLRAAAGIPRLNLADLDFAIEDMERRLVASSVETHLGTEFSVDTMGAGQFDAVVLATGSTPAIPANDAGMDRTYLDWLEGKAFGGRVLVDGRGEGAEYAVSLARSGHEVTLVEPTRRLVPMPYDYAVKRIHAQVDYIAELGIRTVWGATLVSASGGKAVIAQRNGATSTLDVDTVLHTRRVPHVLDKEAIRSRASVVIDIGDCSHIAGIGEALEAARAAVNAIAAE